MTATKPTVWIVCDGTQVHYDGTTYTAGEAVPFADDVDMALIDYQRRAGWITEKAPRRR